MVSKEFTDWRDDAECRKHPEVSFIEAAMTKKQVQAAKAICSQCVVVSECLEYALDTNEPVGVWGGTGEIERKVLRRRRLARQRQNI